MVKDRREAGITEAMQNKADDTERERKRTRENVGEKCY